MKRVTVGILLIGVGLVHQMIGLVVGQEYILEVAAAGGFNTVLDTKPWRLAIFWFFWFGWMLMLLGGAIHWGESNGLKPPKALLAGITALGLGGVFFMPASGFWSIFLVVAYAWHKHFRGS